MMIAAMMWHINSIEVLINPKVDIELQLLDGMTASQEAVANDQPRIVQMLINDNDSKVNDADNKGETPLEVASDGGYLEVLQVLIDHKAVIDLKDHQGRTALHVAVENGQPAVAKMLLGNNSKVDDVDNKE